MPQGSLVICLTLLLIKQISFYLIRYKDTESQKFAKIVCEIVLALGSVDKVGRGGRLKSRDAVLLLRYKKLFFFSIVN